MKIGVMADSHDNLPMTKKALSVFSENKAEIIFHCGDLVAPFTLKVLLESSLPLIAVYGNNDGEKKGLGDLSNDIHASPLRTRLKGISLVMAHDPRVLHAEMDRGDDIGLCGHTHHHLIENGPPMIVNPGETGGWVTGRSSVALVDLEYLTAEIIDLGKQRR